MTYFLIRRIALMVFTVFFTSVIVFGLTQLLPGNIARLFLGRDASDAAIIEFNETFKLNDPPIRQYIRWIIGDVSQSENDASRGILRGDWGRSFSAGYPKVQPLINRALTYSIYLTCFTLLISIPISILLGVIAGIRANSWLDNVISIFSLSVVGLPEFVTALVLINYFALQLGWFDAISTPKANDGFLTIIQKLTLPAITATFVLLGYVTRMTRAGVQEELKQPYVRTAILKGLPRRIILFKHVLRNALIPAVTVIALSIGWLMGGLVVIEQVYNYPGLGKLMVDAVSSKNYPVLQGCVMIVITFIVLSNFFADLLYALLNPKVRYN